MTLALILALKLDAFETTQRAQEGLLCRVVVGGGYERLGSYGYGQGWHGLHGNEWLNERWVGKCNLIRHGMRWEDHRSLKVLFGGNPAC